MFQERINFEYEKLFETGVDEMSWDDTVCGMLKMQKSETDTIKSHPAQRHQTRKEHKRQRRHQAGLWHGTNGKPRGQFFSRCPPGYPKQSEQNVEKLPETWTKTMINDIKPRQKHRSWSYCR